MSATVLLKDVIDVLEMQFDDSSSFLDLDTGRVETVSNGLLGQADESAGEEPDLPAFVLASSSVQAGKIIPTCQILAKAVADCATSCLRE